ncbi:hypothetical protein T439DRAFT_48502 [Meredithblackwellia eburnea MCA 4105]
MKLTQLVATTFMFQITFVSAQWWSSTRHTAYLSIRGGPASLYNQGYNTVYVSNQYDSDYAFKLGSHKQGLKVLLQKSGKAKNGKTLYNLKGLNLLPVQGKTFTNVVVLGFIFLSFFLIPRFLARIQSGFIANVFISPQFRRNHGRSQNRPKRGTRPNRQRNCSVACLPTRLSTMYVFLYLPASSLSF